MVNNKKAFLFDTNFIVQNKKLDKVLDELKERYSVYITQVSIDERIAQNCREARIRFDAAEDFKAKFKSIANISFKKTYDEEVDYLKKGIQKKYIDYFGKHIIPFSKSGEMFETIIDRCNKKLPPFSSAKDASDKGFKDCILWLSVLAYFKDCGENEVVFITDDKSGFRNHVEYLENEFQKVTGKIIRIHPNVYYKEILKQSEFVLEEKCEKLPDLDDFREKIEDAVDGLRGVDSENCFGDPEWLQTFTTSLQFDKEYTKRFFSELHEKISKHIFEKTIPASALFDFDGRITDGEAEIPMQNLNRVLEVYQVVMKDYSQYSNQFFEAATKILNRNYCSPPNSFFDSMEDDLPY